MYDYDLTKQVIKIQNFSINNYIYFGLTCGPKCVCSVPSIGIKQISNVHYSHARGLAQVDRLAPYMDSSDEDADENLAGAGGPPGQRGTGHEPLPCRRRAKARV